MLLLRTLVLPIILSSYDVLKGNKVFLKILEKSNIDKGTKVRNNDRRCSVLLVLQFDSEATLLGASSDIKAS